MYNPTQWKTGDKITASKMNKIEAGIANSTYEMASPENNGLLSQQDKAKLDAVAEGAEPNVFSDWNETNQSKKSFIKNKPNFLKRTDLQEWALQATKPMYEKDEVGLGNVDNTSDSDKPVSVAQQAEINRILALAKQYADTKNAALVNGAPEALDTLKELADALSENEDVIEALQTAIGNKANSSALSEHTSNTTIHINSSEHTGMTDAISKRHSHGNKSIIDSITSALINAWNSAVSHISDTQKHITSEERTTWNTVTSKVEAVSGKGLSQNDFTDDLKTTYDSAAISKHSHSNKSILDAITAIFTSEEKSKLSGIAANANNYTLPKASTTLGGVKTTSAVASASGYTPTPIIDGVPYYKNTNTTYGNASETADGLMASADKIKLNGIAEAANNYALPTATASVLGGVKTGTGLNNSSGAVSVKYGTVADTACQGNDSRLSNARNPTSHASSGTGYGLGSKTLYGHGKAIDDLTHSAYTDGEMLSAHMGYVLMQNITAASSQQPFVGSQNIAFNADGSITETYPDKTIRTVFNANGSISEITTYTTGDVYTQTTTFNANGSIFIETVKTT